MEKNSPRYKEVMNKVDVYNRREMGKEGYVSPFVARDRRGPIVFNAVAEKVGVPPEELFEFLKLVEPDLLPLDA